jgi:hypothetical protein
VLIAAYVVALQGLLFPLSLAAGPFALSLCAAATADAGSLAPGNHDAGCPCAAGCGMQCCALTLAGPPQVISVKVGLTHVSALTPAFAPTIRPAARSPHVPRAPPPV